GCGQSATGPPRGGRRSAAGSLPSRCRTPGPWPGHRPARWSRSRGSWDGFLSGGPALGDRAQRPCVDVVELVPALPPGTEQARVLQRREVLGDGLPRGGRAVLHGQPAADLEERLPVTLGQLVEDRPPGGVAECPEQDGV